MSSDVNDKFSCYYYYYYLFLFFFILENQCIHARENKKERYIFQPPPPIATISYSYYILSPLLISSISFFPSIHPERSLAFFLFFFFSSPPDCDLRWPSLPRWTRGSFSPTPTVAETAAGTAADQGPRWRISCRPFLHPLRATNRQQPTVTETVAVCVALPYKYTYCFLCIFVLCLFFFFFNFFFFFFFFFSLFIFLSNFLTLRYPLPPFHAFLFFLSYLFFFYFFIKCT